MGAPRSGVTVGRPSAKLVRDRRRELHELALKTWLTDQGLTQIAKAAGRPKAEVRADLQALLAEAKAAEGDKAYEKKLLASLREATTVEGLGEVAKVATEGVALGLISPSVGNALSDLLNKRKMLLEVEEQMRAAARAREPLEVRLVDVGGTCPKCGTELPPWEPAP